jgi:parallel beta-helix repeat protein
MSDKHLLRQIALVAAFVFATPAVSAKDLQGRLETLRLDMPKLTSTTGTISAMSALEANILELRSYKHTDDISVLPAQKLMPRGQIGIIPASLVLVHLNSIPGRSAGQTLPALSNALVIRAGRLTLQQLVEDVTKQFPEAIRNGPNGPIAQMPIFIWSDAELVLEKGDDLVLSGRSNSFILNVGVLRMQHAKLSVEPGYAPFAFRPFVTTVLGGALQAEASTFADLGSSGFIGSEGVTISNSLLSLKQGQTVLSGNSFEGIGSLSVRQVANLKIHDNSFFALRSSNILIEDMSNASVSNNLFIDSLGKHAIRIGSGSTEITVANNAILTGKGEGIRIAKGTSHIHITENLVAGQTKEGIVVDRSTCVDVRRNIVFKNNGNGITIGRSNNVVVTGNRFVQNGGAGVLVHVQNKDAVTILEENQFIENASGLHGQAASQVEIANNNLSAQLPIMVSGDFTASLKTFLEPPAGSKRKRLEAASWATSENDGRAQALKQPVLPCQNGS